MCDPSLQSRLNRPNSLPHVETGSKFESGSAGFSYIDPIDTGVTLHEKPWTSSALGPSTSRSLNSVGATIDIPDVWSPLRDLHHTHQSAELGALASSDGDMDAPQVAAVTQTQCRLDRSISSSKGGLCFSAPSLAANPLSADLISKSGPPSPSVYPGCTSNVKGTTTTTVSCTEETKSRRSSTSSAADICRICHCGAEDTQPLIAPCLCAGSMKYVHQGCLQQWVQSSDTKCCELCKFLFVMTTKTKPLRKWRKLDMTAVERRKIMCSVTFHVIAITCVVWSLYVLIDRSISYVIFSSAFAQAIPSTLHMKSANFRTTEEVKSGSLEWPFWTKLIVVAVGFTGGLVFMYVQCKMYVQLCRRWRSYNRIVYVQDCPDEATRQDRQLEPEEKESLQQGLQTHSNIGAAGSSAAALPDIASLPT